jgi:hypothetical protein
MFLLSAIFLPILPFLYCTHPLVYVWHQRSITVAAGVFVSAAFQRNCAASAFYVGARTRGAQALDGSTNGLKRSLEMLPEDE